MSIVFNILGIYVIVSVLAFVWSFIVTKANKEDVDGRELIINGFKWPIALFYIVKNLIR